MRFQCASGPFRNGLFGEKGVLLKPKNLFSAFPEMSIPRVSGHSTVYLPEQGLENTKGKNACSLKFLDFEYRAVLDCNLRKWDLRILQSQTFKIERSLNPISLFMRELPLSPSQVAASLCLYPLRARELITFQASLLHYASAQNIQTLCFIK